MCAAAHLEAELSEPTSASSASCKYVVHHCVCADGSRLFTENNYAPVRLDAATATGSSAHAPPEVFGHPFPVSCGRVKSDRMCVQSTPGGQSGQQRLAEGDYRSTTASPTNPSALTVLQGDLTDYEACSCGQTSAIEIYPDDAAGKYAFWKTQRRLTSSAYCPVYSGQCAQIAEEFLK